MTVKVADYIFALLAEAGLRHVFLLTGGGAMFLNDALSRETRLEWTCHHHEQAASIAAEGYARVAGIPGIVSVTSGPGGINALNGVFGAWTDSIPMIVVSGQVKRETIKESYPNLALRQLGDQEVDIVSMAARITKSAVQLREPDDVRRVVEEAVWLATHGRPGPVWIDVPIDVQSAEVDPERLSGFQPPTERDNTTSLQARVAEIVDRLEVAERPVVIAGTGIHHSGSQDRFLELVERLGTPVTTAWSHDVIPTDHPQWSGRQGTIGDRAGNYAVQAADLVLILGSRMALRQVSYNWEAFAPRAYIVHVDIDPAELAKPTMRTDLPVEADLAEFIPRLTQELERRAFDQRRCESWLSWCRERVRRYPVVQAHHRRELPPINPYHFMESLFDALGPQDVVVTGDGAACIMSFQAGRITGGQRLFSNSGSASMGYDLPASLGAAVAVAEAAGPGDGSFDRRTICLAGDGSLQLNVQELQTLATHAWPVTVFVIDNGGYLSIRSTQANFFGRMIGESRASGVGFPDWVSLARAYGLGAVRIDDPSDMAQQIRKALTAPGPFLAHVVVDPAQGFEPRVRSRQQADGTITSPALDDLYPFLDEEEAASNRILADGTLP